MSIPFTINLFAYKNKSLDNTIIIAHRGGAALAPENSMLAIQKGISSGANMIEIDIHLTKDNKIIVCHDQTIDRTTNGKGRICDMTLKEIKKFNIKDNNGNLTQEKIPTLEEVLESVNGKCRLLIEIKKTKKLYIGIEQELLNIINKYKAKNWTIIQSFNDSVLECIHNLDPSIRLEKLIVFKLPWLPVIFDGTFCKFNYNKYKYIYSFNFYHRAVTNSLIKDIHSHGKEIKIWTLGIPKNSKNIPVDGIITDNPDSWVKLLKKQ